MESIFQGSFFINNIRKAFTEENTMELEKEKNKLKYRHICFEGGYGDSTKDAVIIRGIRDTAIGIQAEKLFISYMKRCQILNSE